MTIKIVALWSTPDDIDGFEKDYVANHLPMVAAVPGLQAGVASKALDGPYYRMAELLFNDQEALQQGVGSEAGQKLVADAGRLQEAYGASLDLLTVEVQD